MYNVLPAPARCPGAGAARRLRSGPLDQPATGGKAAPTGRPPPLRSGPQGCPPVVTAGLGACAPAPRPGRRRRPGTGAGEERAGGGHVRAPGSAPGLYPLRPLPASGARPAGRRSPARPLAARARGAAQAVVSRAQAARGAGRPRRAAVLGARSRYKTGHFRPLPAIACSDVQ